MFLREIPPALCAWRCFAVRLRARSVRFAQDDARRWMSSMVLRGTFAYGENARALRLESELSDLRAGQPNSPLRHNAGANPYVATSTKKPLGGCPVCFAVHSPAAKMPAPYAWQASLPICGRGNRTRPCAITQGRIFSTATENKKAIGRMPNGFFGRSGGTRTRGLQYPKLARYQLRYTSKCCFLFFVCVFSLMVFFRGDFVAPRQNPFISCFDILPFLFTFVKMLIKYNIKFGRR